MTEEDNLSHFKWCWEKTIENFGKRKHILYVLKNNDYDYFKEFFLWKYFTNQEDEVK